jgi:signal transduction histidine kinase
MNESEGRVLVVAPTGRDAPLICRLVAAEGTPCEEFPTIPAALSEAASEVGAILLADEALDEHGVRAMNAFRAAEPPWSDLPVIVLTRRGEAPESSYALLRELGQVSVIERPVGRRPLLSAVQAALRARERQYLARAQMAELQRIGEELQIANSMKDELLALVSHELRTPLTGILGCSQLLLRHSAGLAPDDKAALLRDIHEHGTRLQRVIENMLVLSRAETPADTNTEPILLQRVLPKLLEGMEELNGARRLSVALEPGLPPVVANQLFVEQVVTNLIRNSEKYSAEGAEIQVRVEGRQDGVAISVADRGQEFDQVQVDRMFEAFYRDPEHSPRVPGLGLGLPVCKRLTEAQGGSIAARPRDGGGLEVTVTLPVVVD